MSEFKRLVDKRWLAIGKALPFSIYDTHHKLLLAQGHVVESERSLQRLLEQGQFYKPQVAGQAAQPLAEEAAGADPADDPLTALRCEYSTVAQRARYAVKIAPKETGDSYLCWVIGASRENRCLVMTAPVRPDNSLAPISKGQVWFCRVSSETKVHRFRGAVLKVAFDPYPYLHILVPTDIEQRLIQKLPRALVSLPASVAVPAAHDATIVDISVGDARIAVDKNVALEAEKPVQLSVQMDVLGCRQTLALPAKVTAAHGVIDSRHPGVAFYELTFDTLEEQVLLVLHGFVQQQLAAEYDGLSQELALGFGARI
ncbi:MAG TPA: flagellar brake domain-containing protein [Steroidobacteraceae bacterium]|nr:flagellar brake domain-containing protein [Steroidobacteraceae bacterium]